MDFDNNYYGTACVGTVSGTSISFGSKVVFNSGSSQYNSVFFDPNNSGNFVVAYMDQGNSSYGTAIVGTVSGTSISFGSDVVFNSAGTYDISVAFDPSTSRFVVCYQDDGNSYYGAAIVGTVSGTSISFGSDVVFNSAGTSHPSVSFDPNNNGKFVVCYRDQGNSQYGTAILGQLTTTLVTTNLTTSNYIGFSESSYTDGQTASVMLKGGVSTTQSGLTVGSDYYVQVDGTLDTTADDVSVEAGKAVSATTLLLKGH
ncbi:MAG: hypothetical protein GY918_00565, partial [Gammaproteobacteria bacterium]|nr:hypothetical protein [Gammaproteobacteria bacterium]